MASPDTMLNLCNDLRRLMKESATLRGEGVKADDPRRQKLIEQAIASCTGLKVANRQVAYAVDKKRQLVASAASKTDAHYLKLQNLLYELSHLLREIKKCRDFKTSELDKIGLMEVEEFKKEAPETLKSVDEEHDPHTFMMNRLQHELELRQRMTADLEAARATHVTCTEATKEKKRFIDGLPGQLKAIEKSTEGLQKYLAVPASKQIQRRREADELSTPLAVLYAQLDACVQRAGGALTLEVTPALFPSFEVSKRRRSMDGDDDEDDEDDEAEVQAAKRRAAGFDVPTGVTARDGRKVEYSDAQVFEPSPMAVRLGLHKMSGPSVTILFQYLVRLKIVTVQVEGGSPSALAGLFPDDYGEEVPRLAAYKAVGREAGLRFPPEVHGRAFHWAQWLAGIYVVRTPPQSGSSSTVAPPTTRIEPSTELVVTKLRAHIEARRVLDRGIEELASKPKVIRVHESVSSKFPDLGSDPDTTLVDWAECHEPPACFVPVVAKSLLLPKHDPNPIEAEGFCIAEAKSSEAQVVLHDEPLVHIAPGTKYYCAVFKNGINHMKAYISIPRDYPTRAPQFKLEWVVSAAGDPLPEAKHAQGHTKFSALRALEREVNVYAQQLATSDDAARMLLHHQLRLVQSCFHLVLDPTAAGGPFVVSGGRPLRGRDRRPALILDASVRMRHHR